MPRSYHALKGTCLGSAWALGCNGTSGIVLSRIGVLNPVTQRLFKWWVLGQQLTLHNTCSGLQALELTWFHTLKCRQIGPQLRGHIATESSETTLYPLKGSCRGSGYNQFRCMNDGDEQVSYWLCSSHKALITLFTYVTIYSIYISNYTQYSNVQYSGHICKRWSFKLTGPFLGMLMDATISPGFSSISLQLLPLVSHSGPICQSHSMFITSNSFLINSLSSYPLVNQHSYGKSPFFYG